METVRAVIEGSLPQSFGNQQMIIDASGPSLREFLECIRQHRTDIATLVIGQNTYSSPEDIATVLDYLLSNSEPTIH